MFSEAVGSRRCLCVNFEGNVWLIWPAGELTVDHGRVWSIAQNQRSDDQQVIPPEASPSKISGNDAQYNKYRRQYNQRYA